MSQTARYLEAIADGMPYRIRTSGNYSWIGLAKNSAGRWYEVSRGFSSYESVSKRGGARARRDGATDFTVLPLNESTAPCISEYFGRTRHLDIPGKGPWYPQVIMAFDDGWHTLDEPVQATRANLTRLMRAGYESLHVSLHGRAADFHHGEIVKSMKDNPLNRSAAQ